MKKQRRFSKRTLNLVASTFLCFVAGCTSESSVTGPVSARNANGQSTNVHGDASAQQVAEALKASFEDLFTVDDSLITPNSLKGDFNGDGVEDLAVAVRLNRQIDSNDKSKPPFQFEKAQGPGPTTAGETRADETFTFRMGDLTRYRNAPLLVVIHGSGHRGFTNSDPQQRFVVVDAWHLGKKRMSLFRGNLAPAAYGDEPEVVPPPHLLGAAILMIGPEKSGTAVYWDGARYRWYEVPAADN